MLKNIASNWALTLGGLAITFFLMPFTIRVLGQDQYGTWILIATLTGYLSMLALGIPMATVRFVARFSDSEQQDDLDRTVGSCAGLYALIGLAAMCVGIALFFVFRFAYEIPSEFQTRANVAFGLSIVFIAAGFFGQLPYGIMSARQDFVLKNSISMAGFVIRLGLTVSLLTLSASLVWLAVIQLVVLTWEFTVGMLVVRRRYPNIHIRFKNFDPRMVREILSFGVFVMLLQVGGQLAFQTDTVIIAAFRPVGEIPFFNVASSLAIYVMQLMILVGAVVMPTATRLEADGRIDELRVVFLKWSKITFSISLLIGLFLILLGPQFIGWWIGPSFQRPAGDVLQILMLANFLFLPVRGVALPVLMGLGKPQKPTIAFLIASVFNLGISIALIGPMGLNGVAWGTAIPNAIFAVYVLVLACGALELRLTGYLEYVVARALLGATPVLALLLWLRYGVKVEGLLELFVSGVLTVLVFGLVWIFFVYRRDRYVRIEEVLRRIPFLRRS